MPRREHTSKALRYGTRSQGVSQFYLHTPRLSANGMNHILLPLPTEWTIFYCLYLPSRSSSSFTDPGRIEGWVGLGDWLHTEINVRRRELNIMIVDRFAVIWTIYRHHSHHRFVRIEQSCWWWLFPCCSSAATWRRHCSSHRTLHHSVQLCDRL